MRHRQALGLAALLWAIAAAPSGTAAPVTASAIVRVSVVDSRRTTVAVHSAAMNRDIGVQIIHAVAPSRPAPTLYLLDGAEDGPVPGGEPATWESQTDVVRFFADKQVNVVTVIDGGFSYYTDWLADDPVLGRNKWTTFLTRELPPIIDAHLHTTGRNAIAGLSMSAMSVLTLAEASPALYQSVGSFSGCNQTGTVLGRRAIQAVVFSGGGNPANMWGPDDTGLWRSNDPTADVNLRKLRGINLVLAAGSGLPRPGDPAPFDVVVEGMALERAALACTQQLSQRLQRLGIPASVRFTAYGRHAWLDWQDDLHAVWPSFAASLRSPK